MAIVLLKGKTKVSSFSDYKVEDDFNNLML